MPPLQLAHMAPGMLVHRWGLPDTQGLVVMVGPFEAVVDWGHAREIVLRNDLVIVSGKDRFAHLGGGAATLARAPNANLTPAAGMQASMQASMQQQQQQQQHMMQQMQPPEPLSMPVWMQPGTLPSPDAGKPDPFAWMQPSQAFDGHGGLGQMSTAFAPGPRPSLGQVGSTGSGAPSSFRPVSMSQSYSQNVPMPTQLGMGGMQVSGANSNADTGAMDTEMDPPGGMADGSRDWDVFSPG